MHRQLINNREYRRRRRLLRKAHKGDVVALGTLRTKYHLRLPLIEEALPHALPSTRRRDGGRRHGRGGR